MYGDDDVVANCSEIYISHSGHASRSTHNWYQLSRNSSVVGIDTILLAIDIDKNTSIRYYHWKLWSHEMKNHLAQIFICVPSTEPIYGPTNLSTKYEYEPIKEVNKILWPKTRHFSRNEAFEGLNIRILPIFDHWSIRLRKIWRGM